MDVLLSNEFLKNTSVSCTTQQESISFNSINLSVSNCSGTINLTNESHNTYMNCDLEAVNAQMAQLVATLVGNATDATAAIEASLESAGVVAAGLEEKVKLYLSSRCKAENISLQSTIFPSVALSDCSGVTISALNKLDSNASCSLSKATELLQASGLGTPIPTPKPTVSSATIPILIIVFVGLLVVAVLVGLYLRKRVASSVVGMQQLRNVPQLY